MPSRRWKSPWKLNSRTVVRVRYSLLHIRAHQILILNLSIEPIPDITNQLAPSKWSDAATYFFFSPGGLFLGGEVGFLTGSASASRTITKDSQARERIEKAFGRFRIDAMKREIQQLEKKSRFEQLFKS